MAPASAAVSPTATGTAGNGLASAAGMPRMPVAGMAGVVMSVAGMAGVVMSVAGMAGVVVSVAGVSMTGVSGIVMPLVTATDQVLLLATGALLGHRVGVIQAGRESIWILEERGATAGGTERHVNIAGSTNGRVFDSHTANRIEKLGHGGMSSVKLGLAGSGVYPTPVCIGAWNRTGTIVMPGPAMALFVFTTPPTGAWIIATHHGESFGLLSGEDG